MSSQTTSTPSPHLAGGRHTGNGHKRKKPPEWDLCEDNGPDGISHQSAKYEIINTLGLNVLTILYLRRNLFFFTIRSESLAKREMKEG